MSRPLNRVTPQGDPAHYKTYAISAPVATHFRAATCEEVACPQYLNGWRTDIDVSTVDGRDLADYVKSGKHGRAFREDRSGEGMVAFIFPPGQKCFKASTHRTPLDREPNYAIVAGDHRQYGAVQHVGERAWLDDFGAHQEAVADLHGREGVAEQAATETDIRG
jgi:hypothetical protein